MPLGGGAGTEGAARRGMNRARLAFRDAALFFRREFGFSPGEPLGSRAPLKRSRMSPAPRSNDMWGT